MRGTGAAELLIVVAIVAVQLLPLAVAVWAVVALQRLRVASREMQARLAAIERILSRT